ncbi:MAG: riboflavin synthase [Anaerohalosphaeraceae bacterium]|nr:riboflavin synthase [Anaerohalosphaeraceae bacterium]
MFTGLIESLCCVKSFSHTTGGGKLYVDLGSLFAGLKHGDSVCINGVCQTAVDLAADRVGFDVSSETLKKTTIGSLTAQMKVNVERAMAAGGRFGGHFVQGHIDAIASVKTIKRQGEFWAVTFSASKEILDYVVPKGSIAIDGVSLTIAEMDSASFSVAIIPQTWENTIFKNYRVGAKVNIETDMLCRMIKQQLDKILPTSTQMTVDKLKSLGF